MRSITTGALKLNDIVVTDVNLSDYLPLSGGTLTGDLNVSSHNMTILSGNFVQTSTPDDVKNYSASNGYIQAESTKYGYAAIGSKGYCILSVIPSENAIVISGDFIGDSVTSKSYNGSTFGAAIGGDYAMKQSLKNPSMTVNDACISDLVWSAALSNDAFAAFGNVVSIGAGTVTVGSFGGKKLIFNALPAFRNLDNMDAQTYLDEFKSPDKDNALYVRGFTELGNVIPTFTSMHAEGGSIKATGKYSHAEGRCSITDGRYSHAEGTMTVAGGIASHAEGQENIANGRSSHSEGEHTQAIGRQAHAEGEGSTVYGDYSHAEGYKTQVGSSAGNSGNTEGAHAEGFESKALNGDGVHAEGYQTSALNIGAHAEGYKTEAFGIGSHAEGGSTTNFGGTAFGNGSHSEGYQNIAIGNASHAEGYGEKTVNTLSVINETTLYSANLGSTLKTYSDYNSAVRIVDNNKTAYITSYDVDGTNISIYLNASIGLTEGNVQTQIYKHAAYQTTSHAEGYNCRALGESAHAEGSHSIAKNNFSHAEGRDTKANGNGAHAEGYKSEATNDGAHAEGGIASSSIKGGTASGKASHAEGYITQAKSLASHAEGRNSIANSHYSHVEGYNTKAGNVSGYEDGNGEGAHAEGSSSEANGKGAHAEGVSTKATGNGAHAEGVSSEAQTSYSHAEGYNTRASGEGAHAEGSSAKALNKYAHAEGYYTEANNIGSHAAGFKAKANANYSWCWNGLSSTSNYTATNEGSFCVNPKNEISGFYIGTDNFIACVAKAFSGMDDNQKNAVRTALAIS